MAKELSHFGSAQLGGMPEPTETDEPLGPVDVGCFGAPAQMLKAQVGLQRLEKWATCTAFGRAGNEPAISAVGSGLRINSIRLVFE